jgi:RimJ/RimL family protein N-acetyltransferase
MARICAANAASVAVVRKCGFVRVAREDVVVGDGSGRLEELGVWRLERPAGGGGCVEACWMGG